MISYIFYIEIQLSANSILSGFVFCLSMRGKLTFQSMPTNRIIQKRNFYSWKIPLIAEQTINRLTV